MPNPIRAENIIGNFTHADPWHEVPSGDFSAGWSNSGSQETAAYRKDPFGVLYIKGRLSKSTNGSTSDTIFTLPESYRPTNTVLLQFVASPWTAGSCGLLHITSAGLVQVFASGLTAGFEVGINTNFFLDN